jgi:hypothetical protein
MDEFKNMKKIFLSNVNKFHKIQLSILQIIKKRSNF